MSIVIIFWLGVMGFMYLFGIVGLLSWIVFVLTYGLIGGPLGLIGKEGVTIPWAICSFAFTIMFFFPTNDPESAGLVGKMYLKWKQR
jgi:hypothetical protein